MKLNINYMDHFYPGGWDATRMANKEMAMIARKLLCGALNMNPPVPDEILSNLVSLPLPDAQEKNRHYQELRTYSVYGKSQRNHKTDFGFYIKN